MNSKGTGPAFRGLEESSTYQYIYGLGFQDGFRDYFTQALQDRPEAAEQETRQRLYQQAWQATGRALEKWRDCSGLEQTSEFQALLREAYRDGFRACFEQTFQALHGAADEETFEHLYELAWRKALIVQLRQLVAQRHPAFEFVGAAVRIRHLSELEQLWFEFNEIRGWMRLRDCLGDFVTERKHPTSTAHPSAL